MHAGVGDRRDARARLRDRGHAARRPERGWISRAGRAALRAKPMIRVLVADDQAAVRDGFAALIEAQENMLIAATASNGREAVDLARRMFPHVVLMDIR